MSEEEWLDIFAGNLMDLMEEYGVNQSQLAEDSGISQSTISRYLARERMPTIKAVVNIVYALDCDFTDLLDFGDRIEG